jgi:hypothetical protein
VHLVDPQERKALFSGPYGAKRLGWFFCGYGPFAGGVQMLAAMKRSGPVFASQK